MCVQVRYTSSCCLFFFFNDTSTTEIYTYLHTLSLHDALPICHGRGSTFVHPSSDEFRNEARNALRSRLEMAKRLHADEVRSEEHTSELQSLMRISYAVFCLKKNTAIRHLVHTKHIFHSFVPSVIDHVDIQ